MRLEGKVALVSGSTRGIGRTAAEVFAAEGAKVMVSGRTVEKGERVVQRIREAGGDADFVRLDVSDEESVKAAIDATVDRFGSLTTLVNNAAPTELISQTIKRLHEWTNEEWDRILLGTLTGPVFWSCKHAIPHLIAAGGGSIINCSSGVAVQGFPGHAAYAAGKGGMNSLARSIATEYWREGIRCNTIIVGRIIINSKDAGPPPVGLLSHRPGLPSDITYAALWLASDESAFVTGSEVTVDGGQTVVGSYDEIAETATSA
jgi:NAD(P)-dependent dehydrogenase (short-subunit alcohol dehydrogenase family)